MANNPVSFQDLFNFDDKTPINEAIKIIDALSSTYRGMVDAVAKENGSLGASMQTVRKEAEALKKTLSKNGGDSDGINKDAASADKLAKSYDSLLKQQAEYQKTTAVLKKEIDKLSKAKANLPKQNREEAGSLADLKKQLKEAETGYRKMAASADQSGKSEAVKKEQLDRIKQLGTAVQKGEKAMRDAKRGVVATAGSYNALAQEVNKLNRDLKNLPDAFGKNKKQAEALQKTIHNKTHTLKEFDKAVNQNFRNVGNYSSALKGVGDTFKQALGFGSALAVLSTIGAAFKSAIQTNKEFEKSLSSLSSITGATGKDLEFYKEQAKEIGETTTLSASQAVEAFKLMGSAAPELLKNKDALAATTREAVTLAEAAGIELPEATQALASAMNQFNLPASEANRVINALAAGSKVGAAEIPQLSQALDKAGLTAKNFNVSVEESVAAIEVLSKSNIKGAEAGTQLRNVLLTMSSIDAISPKAKEQLEKFGVDLEVVADKTIPVQERMQELSKISGDATAMVKVFGKENVNAAGTLLQNIDLFDEYTEGVTGTNTAMQQASTNVDNLDGDMKSLGSIMESLVLEGSALNNTVRAIVKGFAAFLLAIKETPKFLKENAHLIGLLGAALLAFNITQVNANALKLKSIALDKAKIVWDKARVIATNLTTVSQWNLNAAMTANPIGLVIVAVAGLVAGFVALYKGSDQVKAGIEGLWEFLKVIGKSIIDVFKALSPASIAEAVYSGDWSKVTGAFTEFGEGAGDAFAKGYERKLKAEQGKTLNEQLKREQKMAEKRYQLMQSQISKEISLIEKKKSIVEKGSEEEIKLNEELNAKKEEMASIKTKYEQEQLGLQRKLLNNEISIIEERLKAVEKGSEEEIDLLIEKNEKMKQLNELGAKTSVAGWSADEAADEDIEAAKRAAKEKEAINKEHAKKVRAAVRELNKVRLDEEIRTNKAIAEDNTKSLFERLEAQRNVAEAQIELQKIVRQAALDNDGLIKEEIAVIEEKYKNASAEIESSMHKALEAITGDFVSINTEVRTFEQSMDSLIKKANNFVFNPFESSENSFTKVLLGLEKSLLDGEITQREFRERQMEAEQSFLKQRLELLRGQNAPIADILDAELALWRSYNKQRESENKAGWNEYAQAELNAVNEIANFTSALSARKTQEYEEEVAALEEKEAREIELVGENTEAKEVLEERYAEKKKQLAEEEAKRKRKQAVFDKTIAATQTIINTAQAIMKTGAQLGYPLAIPFQIAAGVMGAAQLATIIAQPIPKFAKGREDGPATLAIVDEAGQEIIEKKDGTRYMGEGKGPRLTYLEKGDKVIPHHKTMDILNNAPDRTSQDIQYNHEAGFKSISESAPKPLNRQDIQQVFELNNVALIAEMNGVKGAIIKKPVSHTNIDKNGFNQFVLRGNNRTQYLNSRKW